MSQTNEVGIVNHGPGGSASTSTVAHHFESASALGSGGSIFYDFATPKEDDNPFRFQSAMKPQPPLPAGQTGFGQPFFMMPQQPQPQPPPQQQQQMMVIPPGYTLVQVQQSPDMPPMMALMPIQNVPQPATQPVQALMPQGSLPTHDDGRTQLIVNFLDPSVTNADLHSAFAPIGSIDSARVIYDKNTSNSKGFGFVYFTHSKDAATAVRCMTGHPIKGRRIKVSYANQRPVYQ